MALGEIADGTAGLGRGAAQHGDRAGLELDQSEDDPHEGRLARAVGPEHRDELPGPDVQGDVAEHALAAEPDRGTGELDHRPVAWCRALSMRSSWATCHCSKVAVAGVRVSVIVAIGMWLARASAFSCWISGVAFCEL